MIGKRLNMVNMFIWAMAAARAFFVQVFSALFASVTFYGKNPPSPVLSAGPDNCMVSGDSALPIPVVSTILVSSKLRDGHFFSTLKGTLNSFQCLLTRPCRDSVFLHKIVDQGATTPNQCRNLFLRLAVISVLALQILFADAVLVSHRVDAATRTNFNAMPYERLSDSLHAAPSCSLGDLTHSKLFVNIKTGQQFFCVFHVSNITPLDTTCQAWKVSKSGELLGHPNVETRVISSQAAHVSESPGVRKVQRLGVDDKNTTPTSARRESDDIVCSAWKHVEAGHKQASDNNRTIYQIAPVDTLFSSKIGTVPATATKHEWQTQALAAGTDDYHAEGDSGDAEALTPTVRLYNTCQIQKKIFRISGTEEKVKKGGSMQSEIDRQTALKMKEHAKNIEVMSLSGIRADADPRRSRGALNWCITNVGKADDGVLNADGTITGGTARPLTEAMVTEQQQNAFTQGGSPDTLYMAPYQAKQIAGWVDSGNTRRNVDGKTLTNSIEVYESPFGLVAVKKHRNMPTNVVFGADHAYWKKAVLRATSREQLGKDGDSTPFHVVTEHCIEACNEAASFRIVDLTTSDAG